MGLLDWFRSDDEDMIYEVYAPQEPTYETKTYEEHVSPEAFVRDHPKASPGLYRCTKTEDRDGFDRFHEQEWTVRYDGPDPSAIGDNRINDTSMIRGRIRRESS